MALQSLFRWRAGGRGSLGPGDHSAHISWSVLVRFDLQTAGAVIVVEMCKGVALLSAASCMPLSTKRKPQAGFETSIVYEI